MTKEQLRQYRTTKKEYRQIEQRLRNMENRPESEEEILQPLREFYREKLAALDEKYAQAVAAGQIRTLLFGDRFPFRYMAEDYGLGYYAAFRGCSAETEASFETVAFLAGKVDELGLTAVMVIEGADQRIAQTIVQSTQSKDQRILAMDSMQSVTARDVQDGASYLAIMEKDLSVLREALIGKG